MFSERFQAKVKGLKLYTEGAKKLLDLTLEMELSGELAYGVPRGLETIHALEAGDYKRLVAGHEAVDYDAKITAPATSTETKPESHTAEYVKVSEIALARKVDKDEEVTIVAHPRLTFRATDQLMLFVLHHFDANLSWQVTKKQLELHIPVDRATAEEVKGRKRPKAKA